MENPAFKQYLEERYFNQMNYYKISSAKSQKKYKHFQWTLIILSALAPVLAALKLGSINAFPEIDLNILVVIVSSIVAILTTGLKTFNYQDHWIKYRTTYEKLKPEIHYYEFNISPYNVDKEIKESIFISRVEAILDSEHQTWLPVKV